MHTPQKVIGVEQIDDTIITHTKADLRPVMAYILWAIMVVAVLGVSMSCDDNNGMYQGPNDDAPRYGKPR